MPPKYPYYQQPYPYAYPQQPSRRKPARKARAMTQAKHCPYCGETLPAGIFDAGSHSNYKKPAERLFKVTPQVGWIVLLVIVVAIVVSTLPH